MATAGVTHDVVMDGQGYLLATGKSGAVTYVAEAGAGPMAALNTAGTEALASGNPNGQATAFRRWFWEEWRGSGRAFFNSPKLGSAGYLAELNGLRPVVQGAGLVLGPAGVAVSAGLSAARFCSLLAGDTLYVGQDGTILTVTVGGDNRFSGLAFAANVPGGVAATGMGVGPDGTPWVCNGSDAFKLTNLSANLGRAAELLISYAGVLFTARQSNLQFTVGGTLQTRHLGSQINAMTLHEGALWVGCDDGLWRLSGQLSPANPASSAGTYDLFSYKLEKIYQCAAASASFPLASGVILRNFRSMCSYGGDLWCCIAGQIYRASGSSAGNFQLEAQPLPTSWVWSMTVAANQLCVALQNDALGTTQIWAYDASSGGWWRLNGGGGVTHLFSGGQIVKDGALLGLFATTAQVCKWGFNSANPSGLDNANFGNSWPSQTGYALLPLLRPEDLAGGKLALIQVLRIGIEWDYLSQLWANWPGMSLAAGTLSFGVSLSIDNGQNWATLANALGNQTYTVGPGNAGMGRTDWVVPAALGQIKPISQIGQGSPSEFDSNGNGWLFRLGVNGKITPLIRRLWLDYKVLEFNPQTGRRWKMNLDLSNSPESIGLDNLPNLATPAAGEPALSGALLMVWRLWNLWKSGKTCQFFDLDGSGPYSVKLIVMKQERSSPGYQPGNKLAANWQAQIELAEVSE